MTIPSLCAEQQLHDPAIMSDALRLKELYVQLQTAEARVGAIYARWQELESRAAAG